MVIHRLPNMPIIMVAKINCGIAIIITPMQLQVQYCHHPTTKRGAKEYGHGQ